MKLAKDARLKIYPAVIGVLGICLIALLLTRLEIRIEPPVPPQEEAAIPEPTSPVRPLPATPLPSPEASPSPTPLPTPSLPAASPPEAALPVKPQGASGRVRVSNQTGSPVRIALLPHAATAVQSGATANQASAYGQPVHWDFAPGEGSTAGLLLSLPDGEAKLQTGDIVVAFAQDGSGRYWGPYVLGQTRLPTWNTTTQEWQLLLEL